MGNACYHCCGRIQDWFRDSCGCCPRRCCKTINVGVSIETTEDKDVKKKDIRYGYARIYAGVCKPNNSYTCPVLEIYTWRKEMMQRNLSTITASKKIPLGGMITEPDRRDPHIGPLRGVEHRRLELDEKIRSIPIESIISIKYSSEIKKELTEQIHTRINTPPPRRALSCCEKIIQWLCGGNSNNQVHADPGRIIRQIVDEKGERVILIEIQYIRYSNINSPSYFNALAKADAEVYYKERFDTVPLTFYLLNNQDFDQTNFDLKRAQAVTLCRLVAHLKAMVGQYPDEPTLNNIINKQAILDIGDPPQEALVHITEPGTTAVQIEIQAPIHNIDDWHR